MLVVAIVEMAKSLKCPKPFPFGTSDLAAEWNLWSRSFNWYLKATLKDEKDEEVLVGVLLTMLGTEGLKIYDTFVFTTAGDEKKIKPVLKMDPWNNRKGLPRATFPRSTRNYQTMTK